MIMGCKGLEEMVYDLGYAMNDMRNDGFTTFEYKKRLYQTMWLCEEFLKKSSHYVGEEEFLKEHNRQEGMLCK